MNQRRRNSTGRSRQRRRGVRGQLETTAGIATAWLLAALFAFPVPSYADAGRVVVVGMDSSPIIRRLEAELRALGLTPIVVDPLDGEGFPSRQDLDRLAVQHDAGAAISVATSAEGATVWVADRVTGKVVLREVVPRPDDDDPRGMVALRAVELLRASLLEVRAPHPSRGAVEVNEVVERIIEPSPARPGPVALDVGVGITGSPGGPTPAMQVRIGASFRAHRWLALAASVAVPTWPSVVSGAEGEADVWSAFASLSLRVPFLTASAVVQPYIGVAATGVFLSARGYAVSPYRGQRADVLTIAGTFEAGARFMLSPFARLRVDVAGGATAEQIVIVFAGREVARMGWPLLGASLSFEVALP